MPDLSTLPAGCEPVHLWNPFTGEWEAVAVAVEPARKPARRARRTKRRPAQPVNRAGLSNGSPFAFGMADTAYAPGEPLADDRRVTRKPATIGVPHRATVIPAGKAADATAGTRWHDLGR